MFQQPTNLHTNSSANNNNSQFQHAPQQGLSPQHQMQQSGATPSSSVNYQQLQHVQSTLGNQAVGQLMGVQSAQQLSPQQPQAPTNASQSVVQRASDNKDHHQQFLKQRVSTAGVNPLNNPHYLLAEACAYILDHNSYEAKHMNLPPQYHAIAAFVPNSGNAQDYLKIVHDYIQNALKQKTSTMEWGPLTSDGIGTGAKVIYQPNGHAEGTPTSRNTPWMEKLKDRGDGDKTLYVMGHLINADLGGPGLDYNYVPLPGRGGWYGANDANAIHSKGIEQIVKNKYSLLGSDVSELKYSVNAIYPRNSRNSQINEIKNAIVKMTEVEKELGPKANKILRSLDDQSKKELKTRIQGISNLGAMLAAVSSNNYWMKSWSDLKQLLTENLKLWVDEDRMVPQQLNTQVEWVQSGIPQKLEFVVPIDLPDRVDAPYKSNRSKSHKKNPPSDHKTQFQDFLNKKSAIKEDKSLKASKATVAAFLMDMNEYEREQIQDLIENINQLNELGKQLNVNGNAQEQQKIKNEMEKIYEATNLLASDPDLKFIANNKGLIPIVNELISQKSGVLYNLINDYVQNDNDKRSTGKKFSKFIYSGQTPWNSPKRVDAYLQKDGHPQGSSAEGDSEWMLKLEERRDETKTLYVRGHMLNRHLGGAGLDSNMVPLTGREGWYGANNANGLHSSMIEEKAKSLYRDLAGPDEVLDQSKVTDLVYSVEAVFDRPSRPQTSRIAFMREYFKQQITSPIISNYKNQNSQMSDDDLKNKYTSIYTKQYINLVNQNLAEAEEVLIVNLFRKYPQKYGTKNDPLAPPLLDQIKSDFKLSGAGKEHMVKVFHENVSTAELQGLNKETVVERLAHYDYQVNYSVPIGTMPMQLQLIIQNKVKGCQDLEKVLNAMSPAGSYLVESVRELESKLRANEELWQFEDKFVPLRLDTKLSWKHQGQARADEQKVPIVLPSDVAAPYRERNK